MKKNLLWVLLLFIAFHAAADEFEVRNFRPMPESIALARFPKTINDEPCALLIVLTNIEGLQVEAGLGVQGFEKKESEYWIYLAPRERYIRFMAPGINPLEFNFPAPSQGNTVYGLTLARIATGTASGVETKNVNVRLSESNVYISLNNTAPVLNSGSTVPFRLAPGNHQFRFIKQGFQDKELSIQITNDTVFEVSLNPGASATTLKLPGILLVNSQPTGAELFLNEQRVGTTPYQGQVIAGNYTLSLRRNLYHDEVITINIEEATTLDLQTIKLKPRFGYYSVNSTPKGAEVYLDNKLIGKTPLPRGEISSGQHTLRLQLPLYHTHEEELNIADGDDKTLNITFRQAFGELSITSEPAGADVFIDGRSMGKTPYKNERMPSGLYSIRLTKELYGETTDQISVNDGLTINRFYPLSKNFGTLILTASDAELFVDGRSVGRDRYEAQLLPGRYMVKAVKPKHHDDEQEVFVTVGSTETRAMEPKPRMGGLSILSEPIETRGAEIWINGTKHTESTPAVIPLLIGEYNLTLKKQNFLDASQQFTIKENENISLNIRMNTFRGSLEEKARKKRSAKRIYGGLTIAAAGAGTYFLYSADQLYSDYKTATTNANDVRQQMETHDLIWKVAYGVAVPLGIMYVIKASQHSKIKKEIRLAAVPAGNGMLLGLTFSF